MNNINGERFVYYNDSFALLTSDKKLWKSLKNDRKSSSSLDEDFLSYHIRGSHCKALTTDHENFDNTAHALIGWVVLFHEAM